MECKAIESLNALKGDIGFNRNIVECKVDKKRSMGLQNVSFNRNIVECKVLCHSFFCYFSPGFNRNIVECKGAAKSTAEGAVSVLIETLWNVKAILAPVLQNLYVVF